MENFNLVIFGATGDLTKRRLIPALYNLLKEKGETNVMEIVKAFQLTQPTVTHNLKYLEEVGILRSVKRGRKVYYSIHPKCSKKVCNLF